MTSPSTSSQATAIISSSNLEINALLEANKWGGATGSAASITYSFPWFNGSSAVFSGPNGTNYSAVNEQNSTLHYGLTGVEQVAATNALQAWASVANLNFTQVADNASTVGDIRFAFTNASTMTSGVWGYANQPNSFYPSGGDVWINSTHYIDSNWSSGSYNFEAIMHEIGHTLGLKHPGNYDAGGHLPNPPFLPTNLDNRTETIMSYNDFNSLFVTVTTTPSGGHSWSSRTINPETPMVLDIQAIQYIYGANNTYHTGNDIYSFDPKTPFLKTIWDAGGSDTISVTNFFTDCIIDLRPGHYSTIAILSDSTDGINWNSPPSKPTYDNSPNLGIAYNCIIENANGGFGSDTIYGNQANNIVDGSYGTDTFVESGVRSSYSIIKLNNKIILTDKSGANGTDQILNIENLKFDDISLNLQSNPNIYFTQSKYFSLSYSLTNVQIDDHASLKINNSYNGVSNITFSDISLDTSMFTKMASLSSTQIQSLVEIYIASFNRAPDSLGLDYWGSRLYDGMSLQDIAQSFFDQPETISAYPSTMLTKDFVTKVYNNVLNRAPDTPGLNYWIGELGNGHISKNSFLLAIINGALAPTGSAIDKQTLTNKELVGAHYAIAQGLNNSTNWAKDVMSGVTDQLSTLTIANAKADNYAITAANPATSDLIVKLVGIAV
jgi:hypothetical protein